jgi:hypothetical protein
MSDMLERAMWTFVEGFLAVFVLSDLASVEAAAIAGGAAALSVVKTFAKGKLSA